MIYSNRKTRRNLICYSTELSVNKTEELLMIRKGKASKSLCAQLFHAGLGTFLLGKFRVEVPML